LIQGMERSRLFPALEKAAKFEFKIFPLSGLNSIL
jgi:hypothetical protein